MLDKYGLLQRLLTQYGNIQIDFIVFEIQRFMLQTEHDFGDQE